MGNVVGIVQARMGSSRLPGKVLMDIAGQPMLWHVVTRARRAVTIDDIVVATSTASADDVLVDYCTRYDITSFRGSEDDVLDRYYQAAKSLGATTVIRITADCPLLDPAVIDQIVSYFPSGSYDYVCNTNPPTFPDGLDTEVFSFQALETAWQQARWQSEREHVTPYIRNHPEMFHLGNVTNSEDLSNLRWTVDEREDLAFVRGVYGVLDSDQTSMRDILDLLRRRPELRAVNDCFKRNEGLAKSLQEDRLL